MAYHIRFIIYLNDSKFCQDKITNFLNYYLEDCDMNFLDILKGKIIVSSQAMPDEPLYKEDCMLAMMASVINGGAAGLRVAGARDVKNAKKNFSVPVIGLTKPEGLPPNWKEIVYITPTVKEVQELIEAGADIIAFDGTLRKRENTLEEMISLSPSSNFPVQTPRLPFRRLRPSARALASRSRNSLQIMN